jgi:peptidyl-prolyl cis-trans isomerase SurA
MGEDMSRRLIFWSFFIVFSVVVFGQVNGETFNRVVAVVNDDVITLFELNKKIKELTGRNAKELRDMDEAAFLETRRKVLDFLIDERIAGEKIKELSITVGDQDIDQAIETIKKNNQWTHEDLLDRLEKQGMTYDRFREGVKKDLSRMQLLNIEIRSKIIIREEEIQQYYEEHKEEFTVEGEVRIATIFLPNPAGGGKDGNQRLMDLAIDLFERIQGGADFAELAREYSQGPGASDGGDLGYFKIKDMDRNLWEILENLPEGGISSPIVQPAGIQIVKLVEKRSGGEKGLDEMRDAIYGILYQKEVDKRYDAWIKEQRENAYTKIIF